MDIKEQIAKSVKADISESIFSIGFVKKKFEKLDCDYISNEVYWNLAKYQPDIKEALELLELKRQGKLVKLADEQVKPSVPTTWGRCQQHDAYALAQHDMEIIGFKRVETL